MKVIIVFFLSVFISLVAAKYRWGDSSHAMGLISASGGKARHPSFFNGGKDHYAQITTATVLPPFRGDVRVTLEGDPPMAHEIYFSRPIVDLGFRDLPEFQDNTLYNLKPRDRLALWLLMHPGVVDPVCGMAKQENFQSARHRGKPYFFCTSQCMETFKSSPDQYLNADTARGKYTLSFYDVQTNQPVLKIPLVFRGKEDAHAGGHHH